MIQEPLLIRKIVSFAARTRKPTYIQSAAVLSSIHVQALTSRIHRRCDAQRVHVHAASIAFRIAHCTVRWSQELPRLPIVVCNVQILATTQQLLLYAKQHVRIFELDPLPVVALPLFTANSRSRIICSALAISR